jgi:NTP pyrophosphatase (non-canonical NTP hydrolase)
MGKFPHTLFWSLELNFSEFIKNAIKTESLVDDIKANKELLISSLYILFYASEVLDAIKKNIFYGKEMDRGKLKRYLQTVNRLSNYLAKDVVMQGDESHQTLEINSRVLHSLLGITTETGEISELLIKYFEDVDMHEIDSVSLFEEFGDISWYQAIGFDEYNIEPEACFDAIIEKLRDRFPDKFDSEKAINRDTKKERKTLKKNLGGKNV